MADTWILYDDGKAGHHPGYVSRIVDAVQRSGVRPIVASPAKPHTLAADGDWIEVGTRSIRSVMHNWRQMRRVASIGRRMGATAFIDLNLDKNVWAAGAVKSFDRRVHVLHHAGQYQRERTGWAGIRTAILRRRLRGLTKRGVPVLVHTNRAAEIVGDQIGPSRIRSVGFPVPVPPPRATRDLLDPPILLFTGAGRPDKGLDTLVHALGMIDSPAHLRVVGSQPPGLREHLDPHGSADITWVDRRVTDEELWTEYRQASVAVLPYRQSYGDEGAPSSVLLETLGYGVPIVTTPALQSQLPPDGRGAVVAGSDSPEEFAAAISQALHRLADLTREAAEAGPRFVAENHTYDSYVEALAAAVGRTQEARLG
jgi:glycosyltransferase involved in cell wall biosynthesis